MQGGAHWGLSWKLTTTKIDGKRKLRVNLVLEKLRVKPMIVILFGAQVF